VGLPVIVYLGDLVQMTEKEMLRIPGLGRTSLNDLKTALSSVGLHFGMKLND